MVKLLKFTTGEVVVAELEDLGTAYKLTSPVQIAMTEQGVAVVPLCPFSVDDCVEVDKQHVVYTARPSDDILNPYNTQFGSGIITSAPISILNE